MDFEILLQWDKSYFKLLQIWVKLENYRSWLKKLITNQDCLFSLKSITEKFVFFSEACFHKLSSNHSLSNVYKLYVYFYHFIFHSDISSIVLEKCSLSYFLNYNIRKTITWQLFRELLHFYTSFGMKTLFLYLYFFIWKGANHVLIY